eukprot:scaffold261448_cov30-Tisochrysis_lutea.AAC.3
MWHVDAQRGAPRSYGRRHEIHDVMLCFYPQVSEGRGRGREAGEPARPLREAVHPPDGRGGASVADASGVSISTCYLSLPSPSPPHLALGHDA